MTTFKPPTDLIERRNQLFDRQLEILKKWGVHMIRGTSTPDNKDRSTRVKRTAEMKADKREYWDNTVELKGLDKEITLDYQMQKEAIMKEETVLTLKMA